MPARTEDYEVLLDFINDTHDCATVQLLRDYGRNTGAIVLLHPGESVTLVLDAGACQVLITLHIRTQLTIMFPRFSISVRAQNAFESRQRDVRPRLALHHILS